MGAIEARTATLPTGLRLPYSETGGPGEAVPVVFVHAYVESSRYFDPVLSALPASIHAFAPTLRGHPSVGGDPDGFRVSDFAGDVTGFLDAVGITRAVLVGASSGGLVCRSVAVHRPSRVAGLVLISSPVTLSDKPEVGDLRGRILRLSDPIDRRFVEEFVRATSPTGMAPGLLDHLVEESLAIPASVWRDSFLGLLDPEQPRVLEHIRVPTLLLCGSGDTLVRDDQQVLLDRIPGARLIAYDGIGHAPHLAHPARVAGDVTDFVRELAA